MKKKKSRLTPKNHQVRLKNSALRIVSEFFLEASDNKATDKPSAPTTFDSVKDDNDDAVAPKKSMSL